jgi:hypothetical protein
VSTIKPSKNQKKTTRLETKLGEEVQVDFGYAGRMIYPETGKERKTWAFVMTLSWSRHQYVKFVWDQKVETWLRCYRNAFYSVPDRMYPSQVWICGSSKQVRIIDEKQQLVATHERETKPCQRLTHLEHIPTEKLPGLI